MTKMNELFIAIRNCFLNPSTTPLCRRMLLEMIEGRLKGLNLKFLSSSTVFEKNFNILSSWTVFVRNLNFLSSLTFSMKNLNF